jgi:hypothetical protein
MAVFRSISSQRIINGNIIETSDSAIVSNPTYEVNGEFGGKGIWPAIQEFMDIHPEWEMGCRLTNNNGLTVLKRV